MTVRYVDIPGTIMTPSAVCMGGVPLCIEGDDAAVFRLLDTYFDLGGNCIDSANVYGKWLSSGTNMCDRNLGKWVKTRGRRDKVIVATKGGHPPLGSLASPRLSKAEVASDLDESLRALGTDYVDLFYLHRDDETRPVEVLIDYLNEFVEAGKVRYLGCSNWRPERIRAAQQYAARSGKQGFCANQLMWSYVEPDIAKYPYPGTVSMRESMPYHMESGMTAFAYSSLANGFLGKYARKDQAPLTGPVSDLYVSEQNIRRFDTATALSQVIGLSYTEIAIGYVLSHSFPSIAVVGSHTTAQIEDVMTAADVRLSPDQMNQLEAV